METFINKFILSLSVILVIASCEPDDRLSPVDYDELDHPLVGTWRYDSIMIKGTTFIYANANMVPGNVKASLGGERAELWRRRIRYTTDLNYQTQWVDRGDYELGEPGEPNWQPGFGFWNLNAPDTLVHNSGLIYSQKYYFEIKGNQFTRVSRRIMTETSNASTAPGGLWSAGEEVTYVEYLSRVNY